MLFSPYSARASTCGDWTSPAVGTGHPASLASDAWCGVRRAGICGQLRTRGVPGRFGGECLVDASARLEHGSCVGSHCPPVVWAGQTGGRAASTTRDACSRTRKTWARRRDLGEGPVDGSERHPVTTPAVQLHPSSHMTARRWLTLSRKASGTVGYVVSTNRGGLVAHLR